MFSTRPLTRWASISAILRLRSGRSKGLGRHSNEPAVARRAEVSALPRAVIRITGSAAWLRRRKVRSSKPSMSGIRRSVSTRSIGSDSSTATASMPLAAVATRTPRRRSLKPSDRAKRTEGSSSTTRIVFMPGILLLISRAD